MANNEKQRFKQSYIGIVLGVETFKIMSLVELNHRHKANDFQLSASKERRILRLFSFILVRV